MPIYVRAEVDCWTIQEELKKAYRLQKAAGHAGNLRNSVGITWLTPAGYSFRVAHNPKRVRRWILADLPSKDRFLEERVPSPISQNKRRLKIQPTENQD